MKKHINHPCGIGAYQSERKEYKNLQRPQKTTGETKPKWNSYGNSILIVTPKQIEAR